MTPSRRASPIWSATLLAASACALISGCRDLERYELAEHEAYCGSLVSAPLFHEGLLPDGVPPALRLRLDLDLDNLTTLPGTLTSDDANRGICSGEGRALFEGSPLRTVAEALHDPISTATIGEGREQNVLAYVDSTCGHSMLAVLSLMSGGVEVRLFKPAPAPTEDTARSDRPGFGLFALERKRKADCGF